MSKRLSLVVLSLVLVGMAVGCGSSKVFVREDAEPIDLSKDKILILPSVAYGFSSYGVDELTLSGLLFAGCLSAFGEAAIPLEPLKGVMESAGLGGMARRFGYAAYHSIDFHNSFDLKNESCDKEAALIPELAGKLLNDVILPNLAKLGVPTDFKVRYVYSLYLWAYGGGMVPGTAKVRIIAAIYDLDMQLIHSCTYMTKVIAKDVIEAEAAKIPGDVFGMLMDAATPEEEAAEGEGEGEGSESK